MTEVLVGAGGWSYFELLGTDSLKSYSSAFDFVEVNRSYYNLPSLRFFRNARMRVPSSFVFSLRFPRQLADTYKLTPENGGGRLIRLVEAACEIVRAPVVTILITRRAMSGNAKIENSLGRFLSSFHGDDTRVAVEFRGMDVTENILNTMKDHGALHVTDISKVVPQYDMPIMYSRLFGKGEKNIYEFDDSELEEIAERAKKSKYEKSILAFHGVRMYRDAARIKTFLERGYFPRISNYTGLDSVEEVLREDTAFPTTKTELIQRQGWKLFSLTMGENRRLGEALRSIEDRSYVDVNDVVGSVRKSSKIF